MRGRGKATLALERAIVDVLNGFDGPMSSRQVYYQCVSAGAVENSARETGRVLRALVGLRRRGVVPYGRIVDRTRRRHKAPGWDGVEDIMAGVAVQYRRDIWANQDRVAMIACEKAALEGIFSVAVDEYGASLWTLRGYSSESYAWEWAEEILELNRDGKAVVISYFGDFDASGLSIEEDIKAKLNGFGARFVWLREGLLESDFGRFDLVELPVKKTDSRAKVFLSKFGNRGAELDALPPEELRSRIRTAIERCIDPDALLQMRSVERAEQESLRRVVDNWPTAVAAVGGIQ